MAEKANQHFVPQFYFRYFSKDGRSICVLNKSNGQVIKTASIKGQASKHYFYGNTEVEAAMCEVEIIFSSILRSLKYNLTFEGAEYDDHLVLMQAIALQRTRTMAARKRSQPMHDLVLRYHLKSQMLLDTSLSPDDKKELLVALPFIHGDPKQNQALQMSAAVEDAGVLMNLHPVILHNKTVKPFIFSDAPVIFSNPHFSHIKNKGVLGADNRGLIIYYPIGPKHCIMLFDQKVYRLKGLARHQIFVKKLQDVFSLNLLQLQNADSAVYFSSPDDEMYVKLLFESTKNKFTQPMLNIVESESFNPDVTMQDNGAHEFERQLPSIPRLSFMEKS